MDMKKLERAIIYVERMAEGHNPVNNEVLETSNILNDSNIVRCMYFIKDILKEVYDNNGVIGEVKTIPFDYKILTEFKYQRDQSISNFFRQINDIGSKYNMEKIKAKPVIDWLKDNGYLGQQSLDAYEKKSTVVTNKGMELGIYNESKTFNGRNYLAVIYNKDAQEFIVDNLKCILG